MAVHADAHLLLLSFTKTSYCHFTYKLCMVNEIKL